MWTLSSRQSFHVNTGSEASTSSRCQAVCTTATVRRRKGHSRHPAWLNNYSISFRTYISAAGWARSAVVCQASKAAAASEEKEAHKIFDEAIITVKSGEGGSGEIVEAGRGKYVKNNKYHPGGNQPKQIWLPASDPADGADGADVYVVCDPSLYNLLHLHKRKQWFAPRGAKGNPAVGSSGPKRNAKIKKSFTPPLEIPVPPGTVIKRKSSGQVLGEVLQPGDRVLVAKGGKGGMGITAPSKIQKQKELRKEFKTAAKTGSEIVAIEDINWRDDSKGLPGQQLGLQLLLRVVADVGIVGFPNAGKSSLLSSLTRASPEVAPYPFTTLMPNLGVMSAGGGPVLADLPGLIEGAHTGKGLGRMFLRHLRRTRVVLHVVDASAADPATDYLAVREELRMYNPEYVTRPHVVALNKMDLEDAGALRDEVVGDVMAAAHQLQQQHAPDVPGMTAPAALVPCSAVTGEGLQQLAAALQAALQQLESGSSQLQQQFDLDVSSSRLHQEQQQLSGGTAQASGDGAGIASAVPAAFAAASGADTSSRDQQQAGQTHGHHLQQDRGSDAADTVLDDAYGYEDQYELEDEEEWEEGGEWEDVDLAGSDLADGAAQQIISGGRPPADDDDDEDDAPAPLAGDDPDRWLFDLTEEQLLDLADKLD